MTYTFDSGRTTSQRQAVVAAVIARLARLLKVNGGFLPSIMSFGGIVRSYTDEDGIDMLWDRLQGATPAILVGLGDGQYKPAGGGGFRYNTELEVVLYFVNQHNAGLPRVLQDAISVASDTADPGVWHAMERASELLIGYDMSGADVKHLVPVREEELATIASLTLWRQTYSVQTARTINAKRDVTQNLTGITTLVHDTEDSDPVPNPVTLQVDTDNLEP